MLVIHSIPRLLFLPNSRYESIGLSDMTRPASKHIAITTMDRPTANSNCIVDGIMDLSFKSVIAQQ